MTSFRPVRLFLSLRLLVVTLIFTASVPLVSGQTSNSSPQAKAKPARSLQAKAEPASSPQPSPSPEATITRTRRADQHLPEPKPDESTSTAVDEPVSDDSTAPKSEIAALREEINTATNETERGSLQLKLVGNLIAAGQKQEAIAELKAMSEEERFDPQGFYNIANAQVRLGEWEGAIKSYRKAIEQRKGRYSRASNNLGVVLMREGHWDEAYEAFMSALRQESFRYAEASFNLGRLYSARGENDLAVREWRRAVAVDPEHEAAAKALSNTLGAGRIAVTSRANRSVISTPSRRTAEPTATRPPASVGASTPAPVAASKPERAASRPLPAYTIDF
ncbi:MAG: tetratricopeptide repeat protein [Pyrinomonadaceae bacterium]